MGASLVSKPNDGKQKPDDRGYGRIIHARVDDASYERLAEMSKTEGMSMSRLVARAVRRFLAEDPAHVLDGRYKV